MRRNRKVILGIAVALAAAGGGAAAIAASGSDSPSAESQAIVNDAAGQLGISPDKLSAALEKALADRVDAAVAAGRLTKAEGDALKQRLQSGDFPIFGGIGRGFGHFGLFGDFSAAADYLGLTPVELRTQVAGGKSLAQIAQAQGKSVSGLVEAMVNAAKQKLDQQSCVFVPHVIVAPLGSGLDVVNSDKALHNVRAQAGEVKLMNYAMPIPGHVVPTKLKKEGIFKVSCDVHPWMRAWLLVLPTAAYALSGEDGAYKIEGIPPGTHKVKIWHERVGERDAEITVAAGQTATHDVQYTPR